MGRLGAAAIALASVQLFACSSISAQAGAVPAADRPRPTSEEGRLRSAYHQAGHAIAYIQLGLPFDEVSIDGDAADEDRNFVLPDFVAGDRAPPRSWQEALNWVGALPNAGRWTLEEQTQALATVRAMAAGPLAQLHFERAPLTRNTVYDHLESISARDLDWAKRLGMGVAAHSTSNRNSQFGEVSAIKNTWSAVLRAQVGIERDWVPIQTLATQLVARGSLSQAEVLELVSAQLPDPLLPPSEARLAALWR